MGLELSRPLPTPIAAGAGTFEGGRSSNTFEQAERERSLSRQSGKCSCESFKSNRVWLENEAPEMTACPFCFFLGQCARGFFTIFQFLSLIADGTALLAVVQVGDAFLK